MGMGILTFVESKHQNLVKEKALLNLLISEKNTFTMTPRPNSASNEDCLLYMDASNELRNYEKDLNEKSTKDSFTVIPAVQSDDNSNYLKEELRNIDIPPWKDLYRLQNLPKKGLKSPRKSLYKKRKAKLVYLEVQQTLSDEEQAVLDSKLENGEILIKYK